MMTSKQNVNQDQLNPQEGFSDVHNVVEDILSNASRPAASSRDHQPEGTAKNADENDRKPQQIIVEQPQPALQATYEIYRATGHFAESHSDIEVENVQTRRSTVGEGEQSQAPGSVPPSYSTVIKQGRPYLDLRRAEIPQVNSSFTRRIPPPSYAEIQGVYSRDFSNTSSEMILFGPDPIYIWCTRCSTVVVTVTHSQRSKFTHFTAAALCLFGCWPCAVMPYCMNSCKNTYHYCPDCNFLFGMYRPW